MGINVAGLVSMIVFYIIIMVFGIVSAKWKQRRDRRRALQVSDTEEIMIGNRDLGVFVGAASIAATMVGGGFINGVAEMVYRQGLVYTQAIWCFPLSVVWGSLLTVKKMRSRGYTTMLDAFEEKYGKRWTVLFFFPELLGDIFWAAAILAALGATMSVILNINSTITILISAGVAIFYTLLGGFYSVSYTDVLQGAFIFVGLWLTVPFALAHPATEKLSTTAPKWLGKFNPRDLGPYLDSVLMLNLGSFPWQAFYQRVLAMTTPADALKASLLSILIVIPLCFPPILLGAIAVSADWNATDKGILTEDDIPFVLPLVLQYLTPFVVSLIGLGTVAAAVMSSADSCVLAVSSVFTHNIYHAILRPQAKERELVWVIRASIVVFGGIAAGVAIATDTIYGILMLCVDLMYVIMFPHLMMVLYSPWCNTYGMVPSYFIAFFLRLFGGEPVLGLKPLLKYPYYHEELGQQFPYKTFAMLVGAYVHLCLSALADYLFETKKLNLKYDFIGVYKTKVKKDKETEEELDAENNLLGEKFSESAGGDVLLQRIGDTQQA